MSPSKLNTEAFSKISYTYSMTTKRTANLLIRCRLKIRVNYLHLFTRVCRLKEEAVIDMDTFKVRGAEMGRLCNLLLRPQRSLYSDETRPVALAISTIVFPSQPVPLLDNLVWRYEI